MTTETFSAKMASIAEQARAKLSDGAVTGTYGRDRDEVVKVLNDALATEIVCWLRYTRHAISATGINRAQVSAEFTEHAESERDHAMRIANRISELGAEPDLNPASLDERAVTSYETKADDDLVGMLKENLAAERIVISVYSEIIRWLGDGDITTRRLIEDLLADEEEHADDILDLLGGLDAGSGSS